MRTRVNLLVIARPPAVGSAVVAPPVALEMGLSAEEKRHEKMTLTAVHWSNYKPYNKEVSYSEKLVVRL